MLVVFSFLWDKGMHVDEDTAQINTILEVLLHSQALATNLFIPGLARLTVSTRHKNFRILELGSG